VPKPRPAPGAASQIPAPPPPQAPAIGFQTNLEYDPRIDLKTDFVAVHKHGASWEEIDRAMQSWKTAGYAVHRMFFIGSDAGQTYTSGRADGTPHPGDVEMDASGAPIAIGDRPYMVPTAGWLNYLKEHIRRAIDSGAEAIWPEEPLLHAAGGYSPAFKEAWQELYRAPWEPQDSSPTAFFKSSRLKADLYLRAVDELLRYTKEYAQEKGRPVRFLLPVHSAVSYASWNLVFPHASASRLPVDGVVAQVWTGPARYPVTYEGKTEPDVFASSWMLYSYFANLMDGQGGKSLYFLADPVEDDPGSTWAQYQKWYRAGLSASLFFPQPNGYEVMPWPDRIYLPGYRMGEGTPGPAPYLRTLSNVIGAQKELPASQPYEWMGGTRGIGVITLDTMMWQRGGPQGSSMRSLHGLVMPLLKRGVPVEIVPGERVGDREYLARFKVLLLSYDMQKPLGPEIDEALAEWVKAGGALVLLGGEDAYNTIGEWWSRLGFTGPTDHLLRQCGVAVDVPVRKVRNGSDRYTEVLKADGAYRTLENRRTYTLPLAPYVKQGQPVFVRFSDLFPQDGWGAWLGRVRVVEGGRVRADFTAGSAAERPFLMEDHGSTPTDRSRFADADGAFVYRFNRLGPDAVLELELGNQFRIGVAGGPDPAPSLQPVGSTLPALKVGAGYPLVSYQLSGATALYRVTGDEGAPAWWSRAGNGYVYYCGVPAAFGADSPAGGDLVRALTRSACERQGLQYTEAALAVRRGAYVIAHALGRTTQLKGTYVDLFDPDLKLAEDPQLPYREPVLYKQVQLLSRIPLLLHATHRATLLEGSAGRMRLRLEGPRDTTGVARIYTAGMSIAGIEATDSTGRRINVDNRLDGRTLLLRYPQQTGWLTLTVRWIRPEARLTK
jgi:hypothetical protein